MFTFKQWQQLPLRESIYVKQPPRSITKQGKLTKHGLMQVEQLVNEGKNGLEIADLLGASIDVITPVLRRLKKRQEIFEQEGLTGLLQLESVEQ